MLLQGEPQCSSSGRRRARSWAASKPVVGICCEARPGELPNPALSCGLAVLDLLQVLSVSDRAAPSRGLQAPGREAVCLRGVWTQGLESERPADAHQGQTQVRRNPCPLSVALALLAVLPPSRARLGGTGEKSWLEGSKHPLSQRCWAEASASKSNEGPTGILLVSLPQEVQTVGASSERAAIVMEGIRDAHQPS